MINILIAGNAPQTHLDDMIDQISDILSNTTNPAILTYTDAPTHAAIKLWADSEKIAILKSDEDRHNTHDQLTAINTSTGEINPIHNASMIMINPSGYLYRVRKHRQKVNRKTAVIFTSPQEQKTTPAYLLKTGKKANKKTSPRTRRPRR